MVCGSNVSPHGPVTFTQRHGDTLQCTKCAVEKGQDFHNNCSSGKRRMGNMAVRATIKRSGVEDFLPWWWYKILVSLSESFWFCLLEKSSESIILHGLLWEALWEGCFPGGLRVLHSPLYLIGMSLGSGVALQIEQLVAVSRKVWSFFGDRLLWDNFPWASCICMCLRCWSTDRAFSFQLYFQVCLCRRHYNGRLQ